MIIKSAKYIGSQTSCDKLPEPEIPEFAFTGRSNVGKSSLINMVVGSGKIAKISGTPGKTQTINHFLINGSWYLVDLPGYGYAKVSKKSRTVWQKMISRYLTTRTNLLCTFLLIDSRLEPQQSDLEKLNWFGREQLPFVIVFTKADKLSSGKLSENILRYRDFLLQEWEELPLSIVSSSKNGRGRKEILTFMDQALHRGDPAL